MPIPVETVLGSPNDRPYPVYMLINHAYPKHVHLCVRVRACVQYILCIPNLLCSEYIMLILKYIYRYNSFENFGHDCTNNNELFHKIGVL